MLDKCAMSNTMQTGMTWLQELAMKPRILNQQEQAETLRKLPKLKRAIENEGKKFDKVAYQREYMKKRRAKQKEAQ